MNSHNLWACVLSGAIALAYLISGMFFLRFWTRTGDRLFAIFAIAFWVLTIERFFLVYWTSLSLRAESRANAEFLPYIYTIRLIAFLLIIWAVVDKNRKQSG